MTSFMDNPLSQGLQTQINVNETLRVKWVPGEDMS